MGLIDVLAQFGFDTKQTARMVRHQDNRKGMDFDELLRSDQFEEYQAWQAKPVYGDAKLVVSFVGDGGGRARFYGVYQVAGHKTVPRSELPEDVLWIWKEAPEHHYYTLKRLPQFDLLVDELVVKWKSERQWFQHLDNVAVIACPPLQNADLMTWSLLFREGAVYESVIAARRRSRLAREACLKHHKAVCAACGLSFPERYGGLGEGFMHVHHRQEVASRDGEYEIDPKTDLVPICPNCHAMLHWNTDSPRKVEELRRLLKRSI